MMPCHSLLASPCLVSFLSLSLSLSLSLGLFLLLPHFLRRQDVGSSKVHSDPNFVTRNSIIAWVKQHLKEDSEKRNASFKVQTRNSSAPSRPPPMSHQPVASPPSALSSPPSCDSSLEKEKDRGAAGDRDMDRQTRETPSRFDKAAPCRYMSPPHSSSSMAQTPHRCPPKPTTTSGSSLYLDRLRGSREHGRRGLFSSRLASSLFRSPLFPNLQPVSRLHLQIPISFVSLPTLALCYPPFFT
ncbi:hypothetical protein LZ30DRAFT_196012 [Colletotrichum cereale]|nr:hypothetical protein LZ30DRAFT_196012 [Colletotrichum cereale]